MKEFITVGSVDLSIGLRLYIKQSNFIFYYDEKESRLHLKQSQINLLSIKDVQQEKLKEIEEFFETTIQTEIVDKQKILLEAMRPKEQETEERISMETIVQ